MSRSNPTGFVLGVIVELAAVVFIVSLVPKIDLRSAAGDTRTIPTEYASFSQPSSAAPPTLVRATPLPPASTEPSFKTIPQETSYYQRRTEPTASPLPATEAALSRQAPPLITVDPARPGYVEQRLDRASQGLVNSVGSYIANSADELRRLPQPITNVTSSSAAPEINFPTISTQSPSPSAARQRPPAGTAQAQPRPWMRY
jgi:hypothetical protein